MKKIFYLLLLIPGSTLAFTGGGIGNTTNPPLVTGVANIQDFYDMTMIGTRWLIVFAIIIAAMFTVWGGIQYITAGGDEEKTHAARTRIIFNLVGLAVVLLGFSLVNIVGTFLTGSPIVTP